LSLVNAFYPRLLGDIGGTHARFAWKAHGHSPLTELVTYACRDYEGLEAVIRRYLSEHTDDAPLGCALGIANPVSGDLVRMTNLDWSFSISSLQKALSLRRLLVINDFTALAMSLPSLGGKNFKQIGRGIREPGAPIALIGPGTGLGVSGLLQAGPDMQAISGEGGHVGLAATTDFEIAIVKALRLQFGHASAERALSGPGLVNLYHAVCEQEGIVGRTLEAPEIVALAQDQSDRQCACALDLFFSFLGDVSGDLALTLGARGGLFIGGGIVPRMIRNLERSSFRERFESKGRFREYLSGIPTFVIDAPVPPALEGASIAFDHLLAQEASKA
jgi:glucokinase